MKNAIAAITITAATLTGSAVSAQRVQHASDGAIIIKHTKFEKSKALSVATQHCSKSGKIASLESRDVVFMAYLSTHLCK